MIEIVQVKNAQQLKVFIDFPHELYERDLNYVPALFMSEKNLLTKHPFHDHSEMALYLAFENDLVVGRIAAILNNNYNAFHNETAGFFGFFECVNDSRVASQLIDTAKEWLKSKNVKKMIGPVSPSTNEVCGYLVEGRNEPPAVMMPYNALYYDKLFADLGFRKNTDLLAYIIDVNNFQDKSVQMIEKLTQRLNKRGITIRKVDLKKFSKEISDFKSVYNQAWDKNLGFVPMTDAEFAQMAKEAKMILDTDFCLVAEHDGKMVGFTLCIPDINQIQINFKKGRLFPFNIFKLLFGRRKIKKLRVLALGVNEDHRKLGIEAVLYGTMLRNAVKKEIVEAEASWILEGNEMMNRALENIGGTVYKRYRIVEKNIE